MTKLCRTSKCFLKLLAGLTMLLLAALSLASCRATQDTPVQIIEIVKHDTVTLQQLRVDSVTNIDSVYECVFMKGDTVYRDKVKYQVRWKSKTVHDSIYVAHHDTIEIPVKVPVEKKLTTWEKMKVEFGGYAMAIFVWLAITLGVIVYSKKKYG